MPNVASTRAAAPAAPWLRAVGQGDCPTPVDSFAILCRGRGGRAHHRRQCGISAVWLASGAFLRNPKRFAGGQRLTQRARGAARSGACRGDRWSRRNPSLSRRNDPIADLIGPSPRITAVQRALSDYGYGQIKPSGILDNATIAAIEKFEREHKLPVTGGGLGSAGDASWPPWSATRWNRTSLPSRTHSAFRGPISAVMNSNSGSSRPAARPRRCVSNPRLWVAAYLRRCQVEGASGGRAQARRGRGGRRFRAYQPARRHLRPVRAGTAKRARNRPRRRSLVHAKLRPGDRCLMRRSRPELAREMKFDSDLWIVEVEDPRRPKFSRYRG